jgi:predicted MFS family arabinose efflux permease
MGDNVLVWVIVLVLDIATFAAQMQLFVIATTIKQIAQNVKTIRSRLPE